MTVRAVGTKELRNNLSRYLREVRAGTRVLVLDRDEVVAELSEPRTLYAPVGDQDRAAEMVKEGSLVRPRAQRSLCKPSPVVLPAGSAAAYIDADRAEGDGTLH